jgi:hypothetical protein
MGKGRKGERIGKKGSCDGGEEEEEEEKVGGG